MQLQKMSNLDYYFAIQELNQFQGFRLNKIYELSPGEFRFKFAKEGNSIHVAATLGTSLHQTEYVKEAPQTPTSFAMFLRKHLENSVLEKIEQKNFDRILAFHLQKKDKYLLVFEMFAKGNAMLCDAEYKIIHPHTKEDKSGRRLAKGETFQAPPSTKTPPQQASLELFESLDLPADAKTLEVLTQKINLAPLYLKDALEKTNTPKEALWAGLSKEKKLEILAQITKTATLPTPTIYYQNGVPASFCCTALSSLPPACDGQKEFPSMGKALDEYYQKATATAAATTITTATHTSSSSTNGSQNTQAQAGGQGKLAQKNASEKEIEKLSKSLEMQKTSLETALKLAAQYREKADAIYNNYQKITQSISEAREKKEKKITIEI